MKTILFALLALTLLPGCAVTWSSGEGPTLQEQFAAQAFDFGTQMATYKALQQNPEFIDLANAVADVLEGKGAEVIETDLLTHIKTRIIPQIFEKPEDQVIATAAIDGFYLLFRPRIDELAQQARLPDLAQNIRQGISYALQNPDK